MDGFIARTFHQESIVGSFLDPFADKLLIGTLSLSMMWTGLLPLPLAALILGRDGMLIGGTFYHRLKTKDESSGVFDTSDSGAFQVKPSILSKVNTALQLSAFGLALTNAAWQMPSDLPLNLLLYVPLIIVGMERGFRLIFLCTLSCSRSAALLVQRHFCQDLSTCMDISQRLVRSNLCQKLWSNQSAR